MMSKLGYTWYPENWWTSDVFFKWEDQPILKYVYREIIDLLYNKNGSAIITKGTIYSRFRVTLSDEQYAELKTEFDVQDNKWSHHSVSKRMSKAEASRTNGRKGGRPKKDEIKTQEPRNKTQAETQENPPLERERESKREREEGFSPVFENDQEIENSTSLEHQKERKDLPGLAQQLWCEHRPDFAWTPEHWGELKILLNKVRANAQHQKKKQGFADFGVSKNVILKHFTYFLEHLPDRHKHKGLKKLAWDYEEIRLEIKNPTDPGQVKHIKPTWNKPVIRAAIPKSS